MNDKKVELLVQIKWISHQDIFVCIYRPAFIDLLGCLYNISKEKKVPIQDIYYSREIERV